MMALHERPGFISEHCLYTVLDNGIHLIALKQATRQALNEGYEQTVQIFQHAAADQVILLMFDLRVSGIPPLDYIARRVYKFRALRLPRRRTKTAFLYAPRLLRPAARLLFGLLAKPGWDRVRFFAPNQWQQANDWLLNPSTS